MPHTYRLILLLGLLTLPLSPLPTQAADDPPSPKKRPHIFWILVDTLRLDHTSLPGYGRNTTPHIKAFAQEATLFESAKSQASWTIPAVASLLTGQFPFNHGILTRPSQQPEQQRLTGTLIQTVKEAGGYHGVSIQRNHMIEHLTGDFTEHHPQTDWQKNSDGDAVTEALEVVKKHVGTEKPSPAPTPASPLLLFLGLFNPHWPYVWSLQEGEWFERYLTDQTFQQSPSRNIQRFPFPGGELTPSHLPEKLRKRFPTAETLYNPNQPGYQKPSPFFQRIKHQGGYRDERLYIAAYDAEIRYTDQQIGRFLNDLKKNALYDNALIIVMADHGELMNEQDTTPFHHGSHLYNAELAVPLMIKFPHQTQQQVVTPTIRSMDLWPTLLDYLALPHPPVDGQSLLPLIQGKEVDFDQRPVISYTEAEGPKISLYREGHHLIHTLRNRESRLYRQDLDPLEQNNLAADQPRWVEALTTFLCQHHCPPWLTTTEKQTPEMNPTRPTNFSNY
ncbi:MAG: sulfatase [Magnetococcales bacterium]|nr:sulfatase [Magnetococcales bacterium]